MKTKDVLVTARNRGWPDSKLAELAGVSRTAIQQARTSDGREMAFASVFPIYQKVIIEGVMYGECKISD